MGRLSFSGHDTFHCKHFWLKKGYDLMNTGGTKPSPENAVVELGVGKNMFTAIKHWLKAFSITDLAYEPTEFAKKIFDKNGFDPFLEDEGSLWLLQYHLVKEERASIYSLVFNEFRKEHTEFTAGQLKSFIKRKCEPFPDLFNEKTVDSDIKVFLRNYTLPSKRTANIEDDFSALLLDLNLLRRVDDVRVKGEQLYKIDIADRNDFNVDILLFSILDRYNPGGDLSISFNDLVHDHAGPGNVFAFNSSGLHDKVRELADEFDEITFTDDAGIQELQISGKVDKWKVLEGYYER